MVRNRNEMWCRREMGHFVLHASTQVPHTHVALSPIRVHFDTVVGNGTAADDEITGQEVSAVSTSAAVVEDGTRSVSTKHCFRHCGRAQHANATTRQDDRIIVHL